MGLSRSRLQGPMSSGYQSNNLGILYVNKSLLNLSRIRSQGKPHAKDSLSKTHPLLRVLGVLTCIRVARVAILGCLLVSLTETRV